MADDKKLKSVGKNKMKKITSNDISEYLCKCIDDELTEIEDKK